MIILASSSPRRQELLHQIIENFSIDVPNIDEHAVEGETMNIATNIALKKAEVVAMRHPDDVIIACDTIVVIDDIILGKPQDESDAKRMLNLLSDREHLVISGYAIWMDGKMTSGQDITHVYFKKLSKSLIDDYVETGSPLDKAGAYGIQDKNYPLIDHIDGSYYNVMGFPLEKIRKYIK